MAHDSSRQRGNDVGPTAEVVARNVARFRRERGMTAQDLAAKMTALGQRFTRDSVAKLESGTRRADVDDLVALAIALGVTPPALLLPAIDDGPVTLTPTTPPVSAETAWSWALGESLITVPMGATGLIDFVRDCNPMRWREYRGKATEARVAQQRRSDPVGDDLPRKLSRQRRLAAIDEVTARQAQATAGPGPGRTTPCSTCGRGAYAVDLGDGRREWRHVVTIASDDHPAQVEDNNSSEDKNRG